MNPYKLKDVFNYLTSNNQLLKKKLKLGTSEIPIPPKRDDVTTIEAINRFNKANPRVDTTNLKPLSVKQSNVKQSNVDQADEGVIQGAFDTATREAQSEGFPAPKYEAFKKRYLRKNMKADGGRIGYRDGEGVITIDDKIDEMISFYKDYLNQGGKMDFQTFSKKYIPENFEEGGRAGYEDGGMLVQSSDDGSRPGYNGEQKLKALQAYYDKFGKETLDKLSKKKYGKIASKISSEDLSNFKRRITKFEDFITENNRMPTEKEARSIGRQPRIKTEQAIQIKLLEETNKGKFFDPEKFAKENNISMKELKRQAGLLQNNIYNKRMKMSGKEMRRVLDWIPDDASISDNALNKLWKSKLIKYERTKIEELFYDAFGREFVKGTKDKNPNFNPKKHLAIRNNLTEYYKLREAIKAKYPNINLALDHPLSKSTLKKIFNATPDQLTRVNPLEADLNNGFKDTLSLQYEKAIQSKNIPQKKAVEKIARDLKLNIGKVSDDATNFKYGVKEFQKLNMKNEILKAVQTQADLSDNFKTYVKNNPELFKTANVNPNTNITKITQGQVKKIESLLEKIGCPGLASGGRAGFDVGTNCKFKGTQLINSGMKNASPAQVKNFAAFLNRAGSVGRGVMKFGIIPEAMFVAADSLVRMGMGDTFKEAGLRATDYLLPGDQTKAAEISKVSRVFGDTTGELVGRTIDYKNQLAKIQSLEDQISNLDNLSDVGEFDYMGDLSGESNTKKNLLSQAKNDLDNKFKISEAEQLFAESKQDDAYDASKATSFLSNLKRKYRDSSDNLSDVETLAAPEKTQMQLNLNMLPTVPRDYMTATDDQIINFVNKENLLRGEKQNPQLYIDERDKLKKDFMTKGPAVYGAENVYGAQGIFSEPLLKSIAAKQNSIDDLEREAVGQRNKFNVFDRDTSGLGTGLRGFSAASGGIASLTKTIPPASGPTPHGLRYPYNNVKKIKE